LAAVHIDPGPYVAASPYGLIASTTSGCYFVDCKWAMKPGWAVLSNAGASGQLLNNNLSFISCKFEGKFEGDDEEYASPSIVGYFFESRIIGNQFFGAAGGTLSGAGSHVYVINNEAGQSERIIIANNTFSDYSDAAVDIAGYDHIVEGNIFKYFPEKRGTRTHPHIQLRECQRTVVQGNQYCPTTSPTDHAEVEVDSNSWRNGQLEIGSIHGLSYTQLDGVNKDARGYCTLPIAKMSISGSTLGSGGSHVGLEPVGFYTTWWYYENNSWNEHHFIVDEVGRPHVNGPASASTTNPSLDSKSLKKWVEINVSGTTYYLPVYQ
jgi:hypothetical protein